MATPIKPMKLKSWPLGKAVGDHQKKLMEAMQQPKKGVTLTGTNTGAKSVVPPSNKPIDTMKFPSINMTTK